MTNLFDKKFITLSKWSCMSRISERKSNFELLRIFAMLMIVTCHLTGHGVQQGLFPDIAFKAWSAGTLTNKVFGIFIAQGGGIGVAIFFMLSGYFLVYKERTSVLKVCLQTIWYGMSLSILFVILLLVQKYFGYGYAFSEFSLITKISILLHSVFIPVSSGAWWFVSAYVLLILTAPLINQFLRNLTKSHFLYLLFATWFFWYACQLVLAGSYSNLGRAFFFYILGAYNRLFCAHEAHKPTVRYAVLFIFCWVLYAACAFYSAELGKITQNTATALQAVQKVMLTGIQSGMLVPLCAQALFVCFARADIAQNRGINAVAATTFGIYLLHDSAVGRQLIWNGILHVSDRQFASPYFPLLAIFDVIAVFAVCSAIDFARLRFVEPKMLALAEKFFARIRKK